MNNCVSIVKNILKKIPKKQQDIHLKKLSAIEKKLKTIKEKISTGRKLSYNDFDWLQENIPYDIHKVFNNLIKELRTRNKDNEYIKDSVLRRIRKLTKKFLENEHEEYLLKLNQTVQAGSKISELVPILKKAGTDADKYLADYIGAGYHGFTRDSLYTTVRGYEKFFMLHQEYGLFTILSNKKSSIEGFNNLKELFLSALENKEIEENIAKAMDKEYVHNDYKLLVDVLEKYQRNINNFLYKKGVKRINFFKDRYFRLMHDPALMLNLRMSNIDSLINPEKNYQKAKDSWISFIESKVDWRKTYEKFLDDHKIDSEELSFEDFISQLDLGKIFDTIIRRRRDTDIKKIYEESIPVSPGGVFSIEKKDKTRFFVFRSALDQLEYARRYARGGIVQSFITDILDVASNVGISEKLSPLPIDVFKTLSKTAEELSAHKKNIGETRFLNTAEEMFDKLLYLTRIDTPLTYKSMLFSNLKTVFYISRLGMMLINSFSDIAMGYMQAIRFDKGIFETLKNYISSAYLMIRKKFGDTHADQFLHLIGSSVNDWKGYNSRIVLGYSPKTFKKIVENFYTYTGIKTWDKYNRTALSSLICRTLGELSDKKFKDLPKQIQHTFLKLTITPEEWEVIRKHAYTVKIKDMTSFKVITPDNIKDDVLSSKMYGVLFDVENSTIPSDLLENDVIFKPFKEKEISNPIQYSFDIIYKMFFFLKGFALNKLRVMYNIGFTDFINPNPMYRVKFLLKGAAITSVLSFVSLLVGNMLKGRSLPDNKKVWENILSENIPLLPDILETYLTFTDTSTMFTGALTPILRDFAKSIKTKHHKYYFTKLISEIIPYRNLPFVTGLYHFFLNKLLHEIDPIFFNQQIRNIKRRAGISYFYM